MKKFSNFILKIKNYLIYRKENKEILKEYYEHRKKTNPIGFYIDSFYKYVAPAILVSLIVFVILLDCGFRIILNDSMPVGIYKLSSEVPQKGDLISLSLCPCNDYFPLKDRAYTRKKMYKYFAAQAGDEINISSGGISINSKLWVNTKILKKDSQNRKMFSLLSSGIIPGRRALVLSYKSNDSFDSRYFGLVPVHILQKVIPILTFNTKLISPIDM